ncbi:SDR family NAD(P)-dependent oxidoreductase [Pseudomonas orientalis]|uniref:SDR family NAD(P)-dependent oxidoreductase n=1 Tax=Pseudomonas orientalis TaxID=76758 RepID=UPI000F587CDD|nr:SDR family NAD(P)-dependent oxidoreductase [Pseudomonas orientalis]
MKNRLSSLIRRLAGPAQTAGSASEPATTEQPLHTGDIAIIGMACRVPGAGDYHRFWENLASARDSVTEIPPSRWDWRAVWGDSPTEIDKSHARHAGCIDDVEAFDARFFGIAPASARIMDPQQRIMLELSWACLEDAGVVPSSLAGSRTGVFVAAFNHDYKQLLESAGLPIDAHHSTGNAAAVIANRISHFYDLHGPSVLVDTACSGSLSAIHHAVQSLRLGETELALAGGVNLLLTPDRHIAFAKTGMLSPTGACKSFDEAADGYVRSEGAGFLLLKPMAKALADGDPIHGVIKGSAVNHSGKTHTLTYPSSAAQAQVIGQALGDAKISASSVSYVEAHGTGTPKGDPIEIQGLRQAFCPHASDPQTCGLGSAKSNIGHLEAAAGVAGVIKVLLSFKAGQLAPLCHFSTLSSRIDLHGSPFYPVTRLQPWQPVSGVRRAGVSSFGFGGTNGHLILEEPPARAKVAEPVRPGWLIALSAKTPASLRGQCRALHAWLQGDGAQVSLAQLSQALLTGREHLACRQAWVVGAHDALMEQLLPASQAEVQAPEVDEPGAQARQLDAARLIDTLSTLAQEPSNYLTQLQALAEHYRCAVPIAFSRLFSGQPRRHLGVPGYSFARDRFWLPTRQADLQAYRLQRDDPAIGDHVIAGQHRVAGAVTLAVAARAWGALPGTGWCASQVAWLQALDVSPQGASLHVNLRPTRADATDFEVCVDGLAHPLCSGTLAPHDADQTQRDLHALRRVHLDPWLAGEALYDQLRNVGMAYGPTYRALQHCHVQGDQSLLALAVVPAGAADTLPFSPVALDAAFQAAVLLAVRRSGEQARLGFSVGQLHLSARLPERCWVHVTSAATDAGQCRFDIEWIAEDGRVCAVAKDFVLKAAPARAEAPSKAQVHSVQWCALEPVEDVLVEQQRRTLVICADPAQAQAWSDESAQTRVLVGAVEWEAEQWRVALENAGAFERLVWLAPVPSGEAWCAQAVIEAQEHGVMALFALCQGLLKWRKREHALQLLVVTRQALQVIPGELHDPTHAPVHGLAGTLANECPAWQVRMVDLPLAPMEAPAPLAPLDSLPPGASAAWREGQWYRQVLLKVDYPLAPPVYRKGGCYVIVGGAGGIGVAWTRRLIADYQAQVYWIGRRPLNEAIRADIERLASEGPAPIYLSADARDPQALRDALAWVQGRHDQVHGVIHAPMVMRGKSIERMSREEFGQVLAAKVDTGAALAEALQGVPLDFLVFFSSINAFERSPNQSNYAAGCCFIDELGAYLAQRLACPVAVLDWGYWEDAGALAGSPALEVLRERTGAGLIGLSAAMGVVDLALSRPWPRLAGTGQGARAPLALECPQRMISLMPRETEPAADMLTSFATAIEGRGSLQLRGGLMLESWHSLLCQVLLVQLQAAGLFDQPAPQTTEALYQRLQESCAGAVGVDRRWLAHSLRWLAEEGWLATEGDRWRVQREVAADDAWAAWDSAVREAEADADRCAQAQLVDACLRALPAVLGGRLRATEVMFPEGSMARVEGIYKHNAVSDYFNEVITQAVLARVRAGQQAGAAPVRILEIGAGTGGTSARVLEGLDTLGIEVGQYAYTDLSRAFLMHAQTAYGEGRPYLDYRILDVEKDLVQQGLALGSYDLVIATNVLHATADIRQVVEHAKAALKTDGWLLLNELSQASLFSHLTFGLLEGWWRYRDEALRLPGTPGLSSERWQQVLEEAGYRAVTFPCQAFHGLGQQVVMARSDGVVRHAREPQASPVPAPLAASPTPAPVPVRLAGDGRPSLLASVRELVAGSLQFELADIRDDEPFADYGVDSITGVALVRQLNARLATDLHTTCLFDYPSIARLVDYILGNYPQFATLASEDVLTSAASQPATCEPAQPAVDDQAIAIVGISGRFPQSRDLDAFWEHLAAGANLVTTVERWDPRHCHAGAEQGCDRGGFIEDIDEFDPLFFNISPLEATYMDPQQRLFLQEAWNALADAGCLGERRRAEVSVYVGCEHGDYERLFDDGPPPQSFWGNAPSIVPARIAYYLDLQGPAITVDTACSSSLVAIHMACKSLLAGDTKVALAGGVFIQSTPAFYQKANRASMLSPSGACHTFDSRADGFVPGEGVGVVVLKRLADALTDRDHIHGLIRGSGINQDGASNGITAPSALSQQRLHESVYARCGIDPATVQLVEAHGTGTRLGDPIEFQALKGAFSRYTERKGYCAIGSVKSNMGHAATAAAMAGLFKVLLAMRHRQLPPSLHFQQSNPAIDFADSPFTLNQHLCDWPVIDGQPRRAAISSFGFSGTNAHMVLEQPPRRARQASTVPAVLIVLDARTREQLHQRMADLLALCERDSSFAMVDMSYSLLTGRQRFEQRFHAVVADRAELIVALRRGLQAGAADLSAAHQARMQGLSARATEQSLRYVQQLTVLAQAWADGQAVDFEPLFNDLDCQRMPLPGYPFARERYWVVERTSAQAEAAHPLSAAMVSGGGDVVLSLEGDEYFLAQHRVNGERVMPGVAFLEVLALARAAQPPSLPLSLVNLVWQAPLRVASGPVQVRVTFDTKTRHTGLGGFEVCSGHPALVHCAGHYAAASVAPAPLDLAALREACRTAPQAAQDCYRHFVGLGVDYGVNFRCLADYAASGDTDPMQQLLVRLERSAGATGKAGWLLEPGLTDSALQAAAHWLARDWPEPRALVPFSLERLDVFSAAEPVWAHVVRHKTVGWATVPAVDIQLADASGTICAQLLGLSFRALQPPQRPGGTSLDAGEGTLWTGGWKHREVTAASAGPVGARLVMVAVAPQRLSAALALQGLPWHAVVAHQLPLGDGYTQAATSLITRLQAFMREGDGRPLQVQLLVESQGPWALFEGLSAILETAALEYPALTVQCLLVAIDEPSASLVQVLDQALVLGDKRLRWRDGQWQSFVWRELPSCSGVVPWHAAGVYLITGGAGGLSQVLAEDIARHAPGATLVLATRRPATADDAAQRHPALNRLRERGVRVEVVALDVGDRLATQALVEQILQQYGRLDGVVHNAGLTRDAYVLHMTAEGVAEVFAPKVQGVLNLDAATAGVALDFFLVSSSISAQLGNIGQADYAAANRFMDGLMRARERQVEQGLRHGLSMAVDWGYWADGGMRIDALSLGLLEQAWGLLPMPSDVGLQALYQAFEHRQANTLVHYGIASTARRLLTPAMDDVETLKQWLRANVASLSGAPVADIDLQQPFADYGFDLPLRQALVQRMSETRDLAGQDARLLRCECLQAVLDQIVQPPFTDSTETTPAMDTRDDSQTRHARDFILGLLRTVLVTVTRVNPTQLQDDRHFEHYGIDSLMVIQMTTELEKSFGTLSKTLFFEHSSIKELADYFARRHAERLGELAGVAPAAPVSPAAGPTPVAPAKAQPASSLPEPVAIVGLSGRYPKAEDLQAFWRNLAEGIDCVTEVPAERWNLGELTQQGRLPEGKTLSRWGGFIDDIDKFDPLFFNISPHDAEYMDPQERVFLECAYATFEDAGMAHGLRSPGALRRTGVYVGVMYQEYQLFGAEQTLLGRPMALSGSSASIANRVSWCLGLSGPSLAVDSMCSASLTAIHLACQGIRSGDCEMALAGGVNVSVHPNKYLGLAQGNFASSQGRCQSFGEGGDGYVPAEGVGAVLLKSLSRAVADGDRIYGVIRGSQINHGGKANGFTVPNPNAQASVITQALAAAGVDAAQVGYVEAHGTGTALGDPIELAGLAKAYRQYTDQTAFCALGSVKSNIGHCESAAGIAGLTKILLQMQKGQWVPSLHSETLNPAIDFAQSPFVVQRELAPWPRRVRSEAGVTQECPRLAGLSSFGAGGSNAHLIIEEYLPPPPSAQSRPPLPVAVLLSAANAERLQESARRLLAFCAAPQARDLSLHDLAYTLQTGREALNARLGFMAHSLDDVQACLREYLEGGPTPGRVQVGSARQDDNALIRLMGADDLAAMVAQWVTTGQQDKLLALWVNGGDIDWKALSPGRWGTVISLPGYPFARERYWYTGIHTDISLQHPRSLGVRAAPLSLANRSGLAGLRFTCQVNWQDSFLADHRVQGRAMMAGTAFLELARQAGVAAATPDRQEALVRLSDVVWLAPLVLENGDAQLEVRLFSDDAARVRFDIATIGIDTPALTVRGVIEHLPMPARTQVDLPALLARMRTAADFQERCPLQLYDDYASLGIDYGPTHRCLSELYVGAGQALARIEWPAAQPFEPGYGLHPSIVDAALQATRVLGDENTVLQVPFALDQLQVFAPCEPRMWVQVSRDAQRQSYDLELFDEHGGVCAGLQGLKVRQWAPLGGGDRVEPVEEGGLPAGDLLLVPGWSPLVMQAATASTATLVIGADASQLRALEAGQGRLLSCPSAPLDSVEQWVARFQALPAFDRLVVLIAPSAALHAGDECLIDEQHTLALEQLRIVQALLRCGFDKRALHYVLVTRDAWTPHGGQPVHAALHGLAGSLAKEMLHWTVQAVDLAHQERLDGTHLAVVPQDPAHTSRRLRDGVWLGRQLLLHRPQAPAQTTYRRNGVYVVIGGGGGIGQVWTESVAREQAAQVVWLGRRKRDASIEAALDHVALHGPRPHYMSVDATDAGQLQHARDEILQRFGRIDGLVHSAIVLDDRSLANMSEDQLRRSLQAKVDISVRMAQVFGGQALDFVLFFSSLIAFTRNAGQANYAMGCVFKDALAQRWGSTGSIPIKTMNWGYWGSLGVVSSAAYRERMAREGIGSIEPHEAMQAVRTLLASPLDQMAFIKTLRPMTLDGNAEADQWVSQALTANGRLDIEPDVAQWVAANGTHAAVLQDKYRRDVQRERSAQCQVLLVQLQAAGLFDQPAPQTTEALYQRLQESCAGAVGVDRRWLAHSLRWLAEEGWLATEGDRWRVHREVDADSAWAAWDSAVREAEADADRCAQAQLVDACLRALPAVLGGRLRATEVMFPEGSMARVEGIYKHNAVSDYFNEVITQAVLARVRAGQQAGAAPVRILEIGAGTGGTSARVLDGLDMLGVEVGQYAYTDLSRAFLMHAQAAYGEGRPYLDYRILDVEKDLVQQGLALGSYDLVIATNVLHATADIRQVVEHAKAALKTDGWLLLNELSQASLFSHLTFGLLEGWWRYRDEALRLPGTPGLSSERWQQVLEAAGYRAVTFPCQAFHGLGQQVVMARSDGVVRVPRRASLPASPKVALATRPAVAGEHSVAASAAPADRFVQVRQEVMASVAKALKVALEVIDPQESFSDYGLDSITGVNLVRVLNERLGIDLGTTALFDFSTATRLARHIVEHYDAQLPQPAVERAAPAAVTPLTVPAPVASLPAVAPAPKVQAPESFVREPIAIIGMSGQFPGSQSLEQLWEHLSQGRDLTTPVERWDLGRTQTDVSGKGLCRRGGLLTRIDEFDASFFNISGLEATCMDPQQRLFLEQAWTALEDAGYVGQATQGRPVGVYVGASASDYRSLFAEAAPAQAFWGNASSIIPARIAYHLDLQGPAIAVDTACSSSLVAIHLACQALWTEEIDMALAGGVFVQSTAGFYQAAQTAGMLSPSGHCHAFDARADGFVPAEGVGVLILKRLRQAQADGDHIHAVISGIGSNQDGASNGITAPSAQSQERLIRQVHREFAIEPGTISLVEAHGTGTPLGDPIEFEGLTRAFARPGQQQSYCALGSIKSNLGHCVTAAGVAGVLKVALALRHGQLPPAAGFTQANAAIALEGSPFYVPNHLSPWTPPAGVPRRASVSSFGFSGTNAHLVMEQAPAPLQRGAPGTGPWLVVLSARSAEQLREQASNLLAHCVAGQRLDIAAMAYTLMAGRKHHEWRLALVANDVGQIQRSLENWLHGREEATVHSGHWDVRRFVEQQEVLQTAREGLIRLVGNHDQQGREGTLAALAQAFVQGYEVDYSSLFIVDERRRVPLPTYPFLRQSYWVSAPKVDEPTAAPLQASAAEEVASQWLFCQEQWQARDLPSDLDWSACIKARAGARVAVVTHEQARFDAFSQLLYKLWSQAGSPPPSVQRLLPDALPAQEALPEVVFFIGDEAGNQGGAQPGGLDTIKQMLQVSRYLMATDWEHAVECFHVYHATGSGSDCDAQAISGFAASASLENARHGWTLLECEAGAGPASDLQLIVREWLAGDRQGSTPTIVKYQGTQRLRRLLAQREAVQGQAPRFRREGHYLVVGGLGPVGELLCQELAGTFQARLSIVSRSALDAEQRERCDVLRALGATVDYSSVDITDLSALQHVVDRRVKAAGPLQGVIHLARLVDDGLIVDKPWEVFERSIGAKVKGTINLDLATADQPLAFFTVFSSMAAYGIRGSADYGYAAAFQNAFMRYRQTLERQGKRHGVSIACAWGAWCVDRYMPANRPAHLQSLGLGLIDIRAAFDYLHTGTEAGVVGAMKVVDPALACAGLGIEPLQSPSVQCAGDDIGLHAQLQAWEQACAAGAAPDATQWCNVLSRYELDALDEATIDRLDRLFFPGEPLPAPVDVGAPLLQVREVIARVLVVDEPDLDTAFSRYGMDSVGAMQVASALSRALGRLVEPRWLVQHATIRALAEFLHSRNEAATQ